MAEQMQRAVSCLRVFVKAGALLECTMGVFSVPWPGGPAGITPQGEFLKVSLLLACSWLWQ